ncbi:MAG: LrgB family protein [Candidatus Velthaea sp.]
MSDAVRDLTACALTLGAYIISLRARAWRPSPLTAPIFLTALLVIGTLVVLHIPYAAYAGGSTFVTLLLGPATAALAVPLYRNRTLVRLNLPSIVAAVFAGTTSATAVAWSIAVAASLPPGLLGALGIKSATAPVAVQLAGILSIDSSITVAIVIMTGVIGSMLGPGLLTLLGIRDETSRGVAIGAISHGIGTSQCALESERTAAFSTVAMCASATVISVVAVPLVRVMLRAM